ncbi:MAG: ABC transporter substrate-binding protein [Rhodospirillaceae bacterium]|jgi:peptide/nickel transport system substrate-binding protein|nr:ABC transporter substrate-binding protein [Rhodospirillaceae bacterium]MBT5242798.1 ABC transporter substrate-binding protein [Rhodospirillaceae bacterium]MBT5563999.1 ABC transporter substrate-binding protein [Rhodospirillaceae bacterium]MBT6243274.1 ABC transporter substrate-binding protein [Rhodospirillaceae bacterium]MBT7136978.1 ABC transporter substrate-binding protein [Rhodospirillaceae bacterium]
MKKDDRNQPTYNSLSAADRDIISTGLRRGVTRRQVTNWLVAGGVSLTAAGSIITSASNALAATPKKGGVYRVGLGSANTGDNMDTGTNSDVFMINMAQGTVRNCVVEVDANGQAIPELASSLEPSSDAKTWVVKVRKGVTFHSGKTLDADDIMASIAHHRGEEAKSAAKSVAESMGNIKKDGPDTLIFELESGNADFPFLLSDYHITIGAAKDGKVDWLAGDGTGPYSIKEFEPGVRAHLMRNKSYFKPDEGNFDEVRMTAINDAASRMNAMATGQVDAIARCDLKTAPLLGKKPGVNVMQAAGTKHYTYPMDVRSAPFDNNDVRMALKLGIDRETFVKTVLRGYGSLGNDHPISTSQNYHAGNLPQRKYDPEKAKWHLKQAGMSGLDVEMSASDAAFAGAVDATQLYAESLKAAGINLTVKRASPDGYWSNTWMKVPWSSSYWSGRPTADWMFTIGYAAGGNWTETFWDNAKFEKLLVAGRAELNEAKRSEIYQEMQSICRDEGGAVIPCFANNVDAASDKLGMPSKLAGNYELDGGRSAARWWFK